MKDRQYLQRLLHFLKILGPGMLYAGAAIGVSHLVQSTRAGAEYGFYLVWAIVLVHIFKYPFFQFGPRYATATGENLIQGYRRLGVAPLAIFIIFTIGTIFTVQAVLTVVTAGIVSYIFNINLPLWLTGMFILLICAALLLSGRYRLLDTMIKLVILVLALSTIIAVAIGFSQGFDPPAQPAFQWDMVGFGFLLALMGWMPAPLDLAVWHSIWGLEKNKQLNTKVALKDVLLDFNFGYWGTMILAICFLCLGALIMYGSGEVLSGNAAIFASQLIDLFTANLGQWSFWIIGLAALATMFSTTLSVLDAIPRTLERTADVVFGNINIKSNQLYWLFLIMLAAGAIIILRFYGDQMKMLVDIATILAFLTAPVLAYFNYRVMTGSHVPEAFRPNTFTRLLSWAGIIFLTGFSLAYLYFLTVTNLVF